MKREDAFYYMNLLKLGYVDEYNEWLNDYLETENPLSDMVLALATCGSDPDIAINLLQDYCREQPFDEAVSTERFCSFFKQAFSSNRISKEEILSTMEKLICKGVGRVEQLANESCIVEIIRLFFKEAYYSNWMSREEILSVVRKLLRQGIGYSSKGTDFDTILDEYDLAKDGMIDNFDELFFLFLEE